jgi:hypothetical protein
VSIQSEADKRKQERDARLKQLEDATNTWADAEKKRLNKEADFLEAILKGRTGAGRLTQQNVADSSNLIANEITEFLGAR